VRAAAGASRRRHVPARAGLTALLGLEVYRLPASIYDLPIEKPHVSYQQALQPTGIAGVDVLPSTIDLRSGE
jgi:hypothetical protein